MFLLLSVIVTRYGQLREHWRRHSLLAARGVLGSDRPIGRNVDLGGCLAVIDWTGKTVEDVRPLQGPTGFVQQPDHVLVAQWRANRISVLDRDLRPLGAFSNPLLNDAHTLAPLPNGLLVADTGLDAVIALDLDGGLLWSWLATEHGFPLDQLGRRRVIDQGADHRGTDYPTLHQTTHLNSAVQDPEDPAVFYATLFHQGQIIRVDRRSGQSTVVDHGLDHCHALRLLADGYLVCDTQGRRLVTYDRQMRRRRVIPFAGEWIADAYPLRGDRFLVLDANLHEIVEIDDRGQRLEIMKLDPEWKGFQLEPLVFR